MNTNDIAVKLTRKNRGKIIARKLVPAMLTAVFAIIVYGFALLALLIPKPTVSTAENRVLEPCPVFSFDSLISGKYTEDFDKYYSDTFPMRDKFAELSSRLESFKGQRGDDDLVIYDGTNDVPADGDGQDENASVKQQMYDAYYNLHPTVDTMGKSDYASYLLGVDEEALPEPDRDPELPPEQGDDDIQAGYVENVDGSGKTFVIGNTAMELVGRNDDAGNKYAAILNGFRKALPDTVTVYNMVIPKHSEFYPFPEKYSQYKTDQKSSIDNIYSKLEGVVAVDAYSALEAHKDEYIYFRSDHHWTQRGAFYAYGAFAKAASFEALPEDAFTKHTIEEFLGTLYSSTRDPRLAATPDYVEMFKPKGSYDVTCYKKNGETYKGSLMYNKASSIANSYGVFLGGDVPMIVVKNNSEIKTGRKLVMLKESYGNCFATFMPNHFDEVYIIDQRYYKSLVTNGVCPDLTEYVIQIGATDLLFINNIHAAIGYTRINELEALLNGFN